jgi:hypothetical protein
MPTPLLTDELKTRLPELYSQEGTPDPTVQVLLVARNGWMWALTEYSDVAPDGCPNLAFGKVYGDFPELGYIPMDELDELGDLGLVWVDEGFEPRPLSQVDAAWEIILGEAVLRGANAGKVPITIIEA